MPVAKPSNDNLNQTGQNLIRVLIASYFIGVSVGMINGTDATPLVAGFLSEPYAQFTGSAIIFILAYMVMTGIWLRPAALLLGIIMFWSSYIVNFSAEGPIVVGDFWRDIALVGALMLTYVKSGPRASRRRGMFRVTPKARRITPANSVAPRRVVAGQKSNVVRLLAMGSTPKPENIFLDDADDLLVSNGV